MSAGVLRLTDVSWPRVRAALDAGQRTALFAVGSTEQHGPHLPLAADTLLGDALVSRLAPRLGDVLVGPTVPFGVATHHMAFPGTLTLDTETFQAVVLQYVGSLAAHGFETVLVVPSHGGNFAPLAQLLESTGGDVGGARFVPYTDLSAFIAVLERVGRDDGIAPEVGGVHAGEAETSILLAERPDLVDMSAAVQGFDGVFDDETARRVFTGGTAALSANGVLGDARPADAARGTRYLDALTDLLAAHFAPVLEGRS
ncbi:creatininase family protein [Jiangella alkaliphila]|uniref:Creatinine amidohydrolase n=1 Tax=Jiangella alkaliphila TaxID=419479 RepID=A0A1H2KYX7_9ACTN|nr:creatininase family protein [Jiangella alkaliphila]SDU73548.1 creatinine amidohydrolase [Jiangella alkaliphila]